MIRPRVSDSDGGLRRSPSHWPGPGRAREYESADVGLAGGLGWPSRTQPAAQDDSELWPGRPPEVPGRTSQRVLLRVNAKSDLGLPGVISFFLE